MEPRSLRLASLEVHGLRNLVPAQIRLGPRFNVFAGNNAQGKTNLLEAVYLACTSKSFRVPSLDEVVRHGESTARVTATRHNAAGVQAHVVEYRGPRGDWRPLCRGGGEGVLIHGVTDEATGAHAWRDGAMTWACVDGALGRCASLGYFEDAPTPGALSALFQSCTRAVRADYCGDGIAHPRASNGTTVDIYDTLGVVTPAAGAGGLALEAAWRPDGAACLDLPAGTTEALACAASLPTCAGHEPRGVVTRVP